MLSKLARLFRLYCDHHYVIDLPGFPILDMDGSRLGHVEQLRFGQNSFRVEGWTTMPRLALGAPGQAKWQKPDIKRSDVCLALGLDDNQTAGFSVASFGGATGIFLCFGDEERLLQIACPHPSRIKKLRAQLSIRLAFTKDILRASPALLRVLIAPNAENKARAKRALKLGVPTQSQMLDARMFRARSRVTIPNRALQKITIIMPVFNAFDVMTRALDRIARYTDMPWRLVLVEDCSSDARIKPFLQRWTKDQRATGQEIILIENGQNLGFIGSVNRAFETALRYGDHVVLLNSDALVPQGWASRLVSPLYADAHIASVTPLSNDAEIFNAPVLCSRYEMQSGAGDLIDRALAEQISTIETRPAPTGVGFCMAMSARFLGRIPKFDPAFGKGYGEEVDWCQKTAKLGGKHVVQPALFVEHHGGVSFGSAAKQEALHKSAAIISRRYPDFDQRVQSFMAEDPLRSARCVAAAALLAHMQKTVPIYIAHSMGGGAELYLQEDIKRLLGREEGAIVLRVGGQKRWRFEAHLPFGSVTADSDEFTLINRCLAPLNSCTLIYSCAVGDPYAAELPSLLCEFAKVKKAQIRFLVHDYFAISPSYCLLSSQSRYIGLPASDDLDAAHQWRDRFGKKLSQLEWRKRWGRFIAAADDVVCFSKSSAALMKEGFPNCASKLVVAPHKIIPIKKVTRRATQDKRVLGILGDIGVQKGAKVAQALATYLPQGSFSKLVIVGRLDPRFALGSHCIETGGYARQDIPALAEKHQITTWLIPSIWPETFSYTTHEALATGLPVFTFDLGAQGEAVSKAENGYVLPLSYSDHPEKLLHHMEKAISHGEIDRSFDQRIETRRDRGFAA